jgi:hypothetical protein
MDAVHPHPRHLRRTLAWLLELDPQAGDALRIAAVTHDAERAFPPAEAGPSTDDGPISPVYERWHQDRSARIVGEWLLAQGADPSFALEVVSLVSVHEDGGSPEAALLQAADSLSFLEVQVELFAGLVGRGELSEVAAVAKLRRMYERITLPEARRLAAPMFEPALERIREAAQRRTRGENDGAS